LIQLPSHHFPSSHSTVTHNRHGISYSCLVGGLGRICSHSHGNHRSAATENYDHAIIWLGASHVLFRLARSIIDLLAPQPPSMQLSSDNEGPTSPSCFWSTPKFEWLDRTLTSIFLSHGWTAFHICIEHTWTCVRGGFLGVIPISADPATPKACSCCTIL